jgi:hypothetical protein
MQRLHTGTISITSKKDGYVRVPDLEHEGSVFIDHSHLNTALHGDVVEIELLGKKKNAKGEDELYGTVMKILDRGRQGYAGVIEEEHGMYFLVPDDKRMYTDILIPNNMRKDADPGMKVIVAITDWTDPKKSPLGEVTSVLGKPGDNNAEMLAYALERGFSDEHNDAVNKEANDIKANKDVWHNKFLSNIEPDLTDMFDKNSEHFIDGLNKNATNIKQLFLDKTKAVHLDDFELIFNMLGERSTTEIHRNENSKGVTKLKNDAKAGGAIAGNARKALEKRLGRSIISKKNYLKNTENKKLKNR